MKISTGYEIPLVTKEAYLFIPVEGYPWGMPHNEEFAKNILGFQGGVLPGFFLFGYIIEMLVNFFGKEWYTSGKLDLKLIGGGVLNGETVTSRGIVRKKSPEKDSVRITLDVWLEKVDGSKKAVGSASCVFKNNTEKPD